MKCESCKAEAKLTYAFNEKTMEKELVCDECRLEKNHLIEYPVKGLHYGDNS